VFCDDEACGPRQGRERAAHDADDHRRPMHFVGRGHGLRSSKASGVTSVRLIL
jgi:hypothetical protein